MGADTCGEDGRKRSRALSRETCSAAALPLQRRVSGGARRAACCQFRKHLDRWQRITVAGRMRDCFVHRRAHRPRRRAGRARGGDGGNADKNLRI